MTNQIIKQWNFRRRDEDRVWLVKQEEAEKAITQAVEETLQEVESKLLNREDYYAYGDLVHVRQTLKEIKDKLTK